MFLVQFGDCFVLILKHDFLNFMHAELIFLIMIYISSSHLLLLQLVLVISIFAYMVGWLAMHACIPSNHHNTTSAQVS